MIGPIRIPSKFISYAESDLKLQANRVWVKFLRAVAQITTIYFAGFFDVCKLKNSRPLKNATFFCQARKAKILTGGIHYVFRGLKFEA